MPSSDVTVTMTVAATLTLDGETFDLEATATHEANWAVRLAAAIAGDIDLRKLPLVGKLLPEGTFTLDKLQIACPTAGKSGPGGATSKGIGISGELRLGGAPIPLAFILAPPPVAPAQAQSRALATSPARATPPDMSGAHWISVQKGVGPFYIGRVGVRYSGGALSFLLDASLTAAGLSLSLEGLSIGSSSLGHFSPTFGLDGLGIDFQRGPVEIDGAFLRETANGVTEYDGLVVIRTESLCLSAIGSYAMVDGHPSLFVYAFLDYPIGGPSFFFVTGLAAGFGFNRDLVMPAIGDVASFPLVAEATQGLTSPPSGLSDGGQGFLNREITKLRNWIRPDVGQDFLAVGVRFTTFEIIDSFALIAVTFGHHFEVIVLGLSTLVVPTPEDGQTTSALAVAQMALEAWFDPSVGFLGVQAQLTPESYVLSPDCHLTGGFAFYSWFSGEHAGDFVQTLGGYHPDFIVPSNYPEVPRLGFRWKLGSDISIKGYAYYALTAHALMAGGQLDAVFESGPIKAWFIAGADFLISWKPYHYEARVYLDMGVELTFWLFGTHHITIDLSVDLEIWGPDFSGKAHVHLWIVSFTISFGSAPRKAPFILWSPSPTSPSSPSFTASFLPADLDDVCSVAVKRGLIKTVESDGEKVWIINPKDFCLVTSTLIPCTEAPKLAFTDRHSQVSYEEPTDANPSYDVGVCPMGGDVHLVSTHLVTVSPLDGAPPISLSCTPICKRVPAALWGTMAGVDLNGERFVEDAVCGCEVTPGTPLEPVYPLCIPRSNLKYDLSQFNTPLRPVPWNPIPAFDLQPPSRRDRAAIARTIAGSGSQRRALLEGFGVHQADIDDMDIDPRVADAFLTTPHVGKLDLPSEAS